MGILGWIGSLIAFVIGLPFLVMGLIVAGITHLLVGGAEKADKVAAESFGESYTRPRDGLIKLGLIAVIIVVAVMFIGMVFSEFSGSDCDYGRTGAQCYPG